MALVVITGGARSGKSSAAQRLAEDRLREGVPVTVAVFGRALGDEEMRDRIARHQADRPDGFATLEIGAVQLASEDPTAWISDTEAEGLLVIDCLGTLLGLLMENEWPTEARGGLESADPQSLPAGYAERVERALGVVVDAVIRRRGDTLVVTNEVGGGIVPKWASGRLFRDLLGSGNRTIVGSADAAYVAVAGRLISLADLPLAVAWPTD